MEFREAFVIQSLSSLLEDGHSDEELMPVFRRFHTKRDPDVEDFLLRRAIQYERTGAGRTWLVLSKDEPGQIAGYFTIGLNTLHFAGPLDDVEFAYPGIRLYNDNNLPVYYLFLMGKNDNAPSGLSMAEIFLNAGLAYIHECKSKIGGSLLCADCTDQLVPYYEKLGFKPYDSHFVEDPVDGLIRLNTMTMAV